MMLAGRHHDRELPLISRAAQEWFVTQMGTTLVHGENAVLCRSG